MRDDMKMETWAMRITVQRRLGLPLDVACQAVEAGKKAPNGKPHEELGDAAMVNPRAKHARDKTQIPAQTTRQDPSLGVGHAHRDGADCTPQLQ